MVIFSWAALSMMPLARMSLAVSSSSCVSRAFAFPLVAMLHLYQKTVRNCPRDFHVVSGEPRRRDLSQRCQLIVVDVVDLAFGEAEQKDCSGVPHHPPKTHGSGPHRGGRKTSSTS